MTERGMREEECHPSISISIWCQEVIIRLHPRSLERAGVCVCVCVCVCTCACVFHSMCFPSGSTQSLNTEFILTSFPRLPFFSSFVHPFILSFFLLQPKYIQRSLSLSSLHPSSFHQRNTTPRPHARLKCVPCVFDGVMSSTRPPP